jgi:hypothetical protein
VDVAEELAQRYGYPFPVKRSRKQVDDAKRHQAEELEEARQRAQEQQRLHKAESERVKLLLEKRKRDRIFGVIVFLLGLTTLIVIAYLVVVLNEKRELWKQTAAELRGRLQTLVEKGRNFREKAKADLVDDTNPTKDVTALRNLSLALNCNRQDTAAARLTRELLLQHVWCAPVAPEVRYRQDALLAATFAPDGSNDEVFSVVGDGQLQSWNVKVREPSSGKVREPSFVRSLFEKPKPENPQQVVQPGFASFSPDGQWLLIIPQTPTSAAKAEAAPQA